ncbi:MAG: AAA family ATPase [Anaeromicrobium sp.]|uniref:BTAD domain-containing putative transcriptional regulator n=1 Tax=Anaeromicrobium sp. TaxID=1929132 RepID=UPI0025FCA30E|nr:BTAD domain-containing putative transcriptional regulator [Anaeromicrobium sp.]MCT4592880.1 AAA family ATPase [Anaeromicrobium sp.]
MDKIKVKVFGNPKVTKNEENITFPFKKAGALFYYLIVNKQATRDTLVNLLWGGSDDKTAKKNLRQAMYKIRKSFNMDIIISPRKSMVMINPHIHIEIDLIDFMEQKIDLKEFYYEEFLKGFNVKDGEEFESWMINYREYLNGVYISRLKEKIEGEDNIPYLKKLIRIDEYEEDAYKKIMLAYGDQGKFYKVEEIYEKLKKLLKSELGVEPEEETKKVYDKILLNKSLKEMSKRKEDFFYGRKKEVEILAENYNLFKDTKELRGVLIYGEAGIGKTKLREYFVDNFIDNKNIIVTNCYQAEESYILKPWNNVFVKLLDIIRATNMSIPTLWNNIMGSIFPDFMELDSNYHMIEKIDTLKWQVVEDTMVSIIKKVSLYEPLVLVLEDIQWMDRKSLTLLENIILNGKNNIYMVATSRSGYEKIERLINFSVKYEKIEKIQLKNFNRKETSEFLQGAFRDYEWNDNIYEKVYDSTSGSPFFLTEVINSIKENNNVDYMSSKAQDILKNRFLDIGKDALDILNIISVSFDNVNIEMLRSIGKRETIHIIDILEELQTRGIIKEVIKNGNIEFAFTHQKLRDYVYNSMSNMRRKFFHDEIGQILEKDLHDDKRDRFLYPKLIYHFKNAHNTIKYLKYKGLNLDVYMSFSHELFPVLRDGNIENEYATYLTHKEEKKALDELEEEIKVLNEEKYYLKEVKDINMRFFHMLGRYLIMKGQYEKGTNAIEKIIYLARENENPDYGIKAYLQMIYYGIKINDHKWMDKYIKLAMDIAKRCSYEKDLAILLRLRGIERMMVGKYHEAEESLKQSLKIFEKKDRYKEKYILNRAACYNYMGEIRRRNMKFTSALYYYDLAIAICNEENITRSFAIFNTNAGQAALDMGDYHRAKEYLKEAIRNYESLNIIWGRSIASCYMSLLYVIDGRYKKALNLFSEGKKYAKSLKSPYEMGIYNRVCAEIRMKMNKNKELNNIFKDAIRKNVVEYCKEGIGNLEDLSTPYEINILKVFMKNSGDDL